MKHERTVGISERTAAGFLLEESSGALTRTVAEVDNGR